MRTKPCLTSADVAKMMAACLAEAEKNKWNVAVAILDDGGHLLAFQRMDGTGAISAEVAIGKARTSALTKRPSKFFEERVKERPGFVTFPAGMLIQGGCRSCTRTSAIGVSGVASHEDEQIARAGVKALG